MLFHGNETNTLRLEVVNSFAEPQRRGTLICHLPLLSEGDTLFSLHLWGYLRCGWRLTLCTGALLSQPQLGICLAYFPA